MLFAKGGPASAAGVDLPDPDGAADFGISRPVAATNPDGARAGTRNSTKEFKTIFIDQNKTRPAATATSALQPQLTVARAPANGNVLLVTTNATVVINPQLFKDVVQFDPVKDFAPVSLLARQPFVLVVDNNLPVTTVGELIDYARAHPGKLNFGSSGAGGGAHLSGEMLKTLMKLKMTHVPYKGVAPALQDVIAGHIDFMFASLLTAKPLVEGKQLRGLAVTSKTRNPAMPDLPAMAEFPGLENFEADLWYGLLAPANTDPAIVAKLYQATLHAFQDPGLKARFDATGTVLVGTSPDEFARIIKTDIDKWAIVIKAADMLNPK